MTDIYAPREVDRQFRWRCDECETVRNINVGWDWEGGEAGSILATYPVFSVDCPGMIETEAGDVLSDTVSEDDWLHTVPHCPFNDYDDYENPDLRALISLWMQARDYERGWCRVPR